MSAAQAGRTMLKQGARRDPELYILLAVMSGAFGLAGFYFGRMPTSATSENTSINVAKESMPWHIGADTGSDKEFKYKYHPGGDARNTAKHAPSAMHSVIIQKLNLPKELHEKYNKWGKDGY
ncbi:hypothetical protein Q9L58_002534 [Maublancomyces gigas]|uniref:Uncharacterized protein n=1 Tax=Discina gigas TaxID=1032678 RepID=A0ABR3GR34_9PEZI